MHRCLVLLLLALPVAACSLLARPGLLFGGRGVVEARVVEGVNGDRPVAVDLVVVYDEGVEKDLLAMTAEQWFARRGQYLQVTPESSVEVFSWEWVPGQWVGRQPFEYRVGALRSIVFASYDTPGPHRAQLRPDRSFRLLMGEQDFRIEAIR
jgi:type VI secretion system protein